MADADAEHGLSNEPASETFVLEDEDHTLANALRYFLNKKCAPTVVSPAQAFTLRLSDDKLLDSPHVDFCGYSIPHPADPVVNVRIQTTGVLSRLSLFASKVAVPRELCLPSRLCRIYVCMCRGDIGSRGPSTGLPEPEGGVLPCQGQVPSGRG